VTYAFTRSALINNREDSVISQARENADQVEAELGSNPASLLPTLESVGAGSSPLVLARGEWTALTSQFGPEALPAELRDQVIEQGAPSRMLYRFDGQPVLGVGIPLPAVDANYFEIVSMAEVQSTLNSVSLALIVATAITTSLGLLLGSLAARRAVRPLGDAAQAAKAIAGGRLDTRLEPTEDRDLAQLARAFNDMAAALQERVERDARFASDVSHELRSPLTTLSASIEVLQARREEMPERAAAALDLLVADVARFQGLVDDLLEISRFDAGAIRLDREDLLVAEFVRQAVAVSSLPGAPVKVDEAAEELVIRGDKRRLARVIANLVDNGRYYGGGEVELTVQPAAPGDEGEPPDQVWISVEDHGPGVPPDERKLVFERFSRGTGAGRRSMGEGAGLGLALVDEHVRLHGGRVWVEDRSDGAPGARFVIELPVT
jgi:signal transduction histidine kinase